VAFHFAARGTSIDCTLWWLAPPDPVVAYFSMEIALEPEFPIYSGGLGILAGDTLRAAADLGVPMVGVTLVYRLGYFRQHLDSDGNQTESPNPWQPEGVLQPVDSMVSIPLKGRFVHVRAWRYVVRGLTGSTIPVYLLDTNMPQNTEEDRRLTDVLYGGDQAYRLSQETVLGMGGIAMLRALGHQRLATYHMNEGHSALLTLALLAEQVGARGLAGATMTDRLNVHQRCVFTTHTPVAAGHDRFPERLVRDVLGDDFVSAITTIGLMGRGELNMTELALTFSRYVNGVAMRHGEVAREMFPNYPINAITNGVHAVTWSAPSVAQMFDRHLPEWRQDNLYLRYAISISSADLRAAHTQAKAELLAEVQKRTGRQLSPNTLTIGFARRATAYKRADLLFTDLQRLRRIVSQVGPLQVIYSGKAHPKDEGGKALIRQVFAAAKALGSTLPVVYLEEYDMTLARLMCAGVDVWLNTPQRPMEASGTSGMKAAINGVPSLSILDGWWIEGHIEGVTGWAIGDGTEAIGELSVEVESLYSKLENVVVPMFYRDTNSYAKVMQMVIAVNGSFFNTERMVDQYVTNAYRLPVTISA
jgi:starch phosphorylase